MSNDAQDAQGAGNTEDGPLINKKRVRAYVFTLNMKNRVYVDACDLQEVLGEYCEKYLFQLEQGENSEHQHYQGYIYFKNPKSFKQVQDIFGDSNPHIEVCRNNKKAIEYCQKIQTRVKGPWSKGIVITRKQIKDPLEGKTLHEFQQKIMDIIEEEPDDRTIYWFYDHKGGAGKTALAKHLLLKRQDVAYVSGKGGDIKYIIKNFIHERGEPRVVIIDIPRCQDITYISYGAIEEIKNGMIINTKYESSTEVFNCPHIIIFSNDQPNTDKFSKDRWVIENVSKGKKFIP